MTRRADAVVTAAVALGDAYRANDAKAFAAALVALWDAGYAQAQADHREAERVTFGEVEVFEDEAPEADAPGELVFGADGSVHVID